MSTSTPTIIVTPSVLLREGIASVLQNTHYKVVATAARPAELPHVPYSKGQANLAVLGMDAGNGNLDEIRKSIRLLRSLMPECKVALIIEANEQIDPQRVLTLSAHACIFNLGSRDTLIKILELTFMDQPVFVLSDSMAMTASDPAVKTVANTDDVPNNHAGASPTFVSRYVAEASDELRVMTPDERACRDALSTRERQILVSLTKGGSNKAIARLYNLAEPTVKAHLKTILRKTKTHNRTQAAIWAIQHGFLNHSFEHSLARPGRPVTIRSVASDHDCGSIGDAHRRS